MDLANILQGVKRRLWR